MTSVPPTQARNRFATFREVCERPPPSCSVVRCNLVGAPNKRRHRFVTALRELSEDTGYRYSGYVLRRVNQHIEVVIVVPPTTEEQLVDLFHLLAEFAVDDASFVFEATNYDEYHRLRQPFRLIRQAGEENDDPDDVGPARYVVASSIDSHGSGSSSGFD